MPEIADLNSIRTTVPTYATLQALRAKIDVWIHNILMGNGTFGGAEYEERGDVGFRIDPSKQVTNLMAWRDRITKDLENPELLGEVVYQVSVFESEYCRQMSNEPPLCADC